jgi:hypothetical protein
MCLVVPPPRLGSAAVVFFGQHGDISHHAQQRGVSRQRLYREADSVVRDLDARTLPPQIAQQQQTIAALPARRRRSPRPCRLLLS